ncbi:DUF6228 family protein [Streptomyces caelestis]|uniref:DUF6228 family protein n=1 Tax=Streptomyces caelestis TaxID=36816 RepID=UPI00364C2C0D
MTATFGSGGHAYLCRTLRPGSFPEGWTCTVTTVIETGEGTTAVAGDHREFLRQGRTARVAWRTPCAKGVCAVPKAAFSCPACRRFGAASSPSQACG